MQLNRVQQELNRGVVNLAKCNKGPEPQSVTIRWNGGLWVLRFPRIFQGSSWIFQESGMDFGMICAHQRTDKFIKLY